MSTARAARASDARAREDATTAGETSPRRGQRARAMKTTARADASAMRTTARAERTTSMGRKRARRDGDATAARTTATEEDEREREGEREGVDASGTRATTTATTSANARSANPWSVANSLDVNDVAMVQNLLERSLRLYMSKREVVAHLQALANIDPVLTQLVWGQLEKSNPEFFEAYRVMVQVKDQIIRFNALLEKQHEWMQKNGAAGRGGEPKAKVKAKASPKRNKTAQTKTPAAETETPARASNASGAKTSELPVLTPGINAGLTGVGAVGVADAALFGGTPYTANPDLHEEITKLMMETPAMNASVADLQLDFEKHMADLMPRDADHPASSLPRDFSLDDIPDFNL